MTDILSLLCGGFTLLLALATPLLSPFFRRLKAEEAEENGDEESALPPVSIVITAHDNAMELDRHLPAWLSLQYAPGYEVIVVADKGDHETEDVLKRHSLQHPHLYATFIPSSSRYMSRKKLAITLGVKAAKNEWVALTDATCVPQSPLWLQTMSTNCKENKNLVLGYAAYAPETKSYYRFERVRTALYLLRKAQGGTAYRSNTPNIMFRKSEFIGHDGYRGNLEHIRGEYDFLVNTYAQKGHTAVETREEAWLTEDQPSAKTWKNDQIQAFHNRLYLGHSKAIKALRTLDTGAFHLTLLAILATGAYSALTEQWQLAVLAGAALLVHIVLRTVLARKALALFEEETASWKLFPMEWSVMWRDLLLKTRYKRADKMDFSTHKL